MLSYPATIPLSSRTLTTSPNASAATVSSADPGGGAWNPAGRRCSLSPTCVTATPTPASRPASRSASPPLGATCKKR